MKKQLKLFTIPLLLLIIFGGCRKGLQTDINRNAEFTAKFFDLSKPIKPEVRRVYDDLKRQNQLTNFIGNFAQREGIPIWDKAKVFDNIKNNMLRGDSSSNSTNDSIAFIPLAIENTEKVNAIIIAKLDGNVTLKLMRAKEYIDFLPNAIGIKDNIMSAKEYAQLFMALNMEAFNTEKFEIKDTRIFQEDIPADVKPEEMTYRVIHIPLNGGELICYMGDGRMMNYDQAMQGMAPGEEIKWEDDDDYCIVRTATKADEIINDDDWYPGGGSTTGNGSDGGGGSSGINTICPTCPAPVYCNNDGLIANGVPPCNPYDNNDGWDPFFDYENVNNYTLDNPNTVTPTKQPCPTATNNLGTTLTNTLNAVENTTDMKNLRSKKSEHSEYGLSITQNGTNFGTSNPVGGTSGTKVQTTTYSSTSNIIATVHTHPDCDPNNPSAAPSPLDLYHISIGNIGSTTPPVTTANPNLNSEFVIASTGQEYAIAVKDPAKLNAFLTKYPVGQNLSGVNFWANNGTDNLFDLAVKYTKYLLSSGYEIKGLDGYLMAAMLKKLDCGVQLFVKENGNFKGLDATISGPNDPLKIEITICQ